MNPVAATLANEEKLGGAVGGAVTTPAIDTPDDGAQVATRLGPDSILAYDSA